MDTNKVNIRSLSVWWCFYVLSNTWSSIHENVQQHWSWVEKKHVLAQVKAGNKSYKLKNKIRQMVYLHYQHKTKNYSKTKQNYLINNLIKSLR